MNSDIFEQKINSILKIGRPPKILLFDQESCKILSSIATYTRFLQNDFYLFDYITNKRRAKMSSVTCFIVCRPENHRLIREELLEPFYTNYIILFTNEISDTVLSDIALWDVSGLIESIYEIYIDVLRKDNFLYTININNTMMNYGCDLDLKRIVDGLVSLLKTLKVNPNIIHQNGFERPKSLANSLKTSYVMDESWNNAHLLILDRGFDLNTPLVYNWTFQSMIDEYLEYDNVIKHNNDVYDFSQSEFFDKIKFLDVNAAINEIQKFVDSLEKKKVSEDYINMIDKKNKDNAEAENLLKIQNHIVKMCLENKDLSEQEYMMIKYQKMDIKELNLILTSENIKHYKKVKILMIYFLTTGYRFELSRINELEKNIPSIREYEHLISNFLKKFAFPYESSRNINRNLQKYKPTFNNQEDIKLSYEPTLSKIIQSLIKNKIDKQNFYVENELLYNLKYIVVYVCGGLTYSEYRVTMQNLLKEDVINHNVQIYLVSDTMINYRSIYQIIK